MKKKWVIGALGAALVFGGTFAVGAADHDEVHSLNGARHNQNSISQAEATSIADKTVNGKVIEIDASTGKFLDVEWVD